jgi:hypothetical protein
MTSRGGAEEVARAIAFFQTCTDAELLRGVLKAIQPRAAAEARKYSNREPPNPAAIAPALAPGTQEEALRTARTVKDFAQLQSLARAVGRRVEELRGMN